MRSTTYESEYDVGGALAEVAKNMTAHLKRTKHLEAELYAFVQRLAQATELVTTEGERKAKARKVSRKINRELLRRKPWEADELAKLDEMYPEMGARVVALRLGRSLSSIRAKASERDLKLRRPAHLLHMATEHNTEDEHGW